MQFKIKTADGSTQEIDLSMSSLHAMRDTRASTIGKFVEQKYGPAAEGTTMTSQLAANMGITPGSTLADAMDAKNYRGPALDAATVGGDGSVVGRLVVQAVLFEAIETHMRDDLSGYARMLSDNAAIRRSIDGTRWETPILDFTRPANARPQPVAQLTEPTRMLTLKTSMKSNAIMGEALGIEYSDQVAQNVTIDVISLSMKRQAEEAAAALAMYQIMTLLNGDVDYGMAALASVIPGGAVLASSLDSAAGSGKLTQTAWVKWLWRNNLRRTITTVITDLDGALAIENRAGRPLVNDNFGTSKRIDTMDNILNPRWPDKVDVIITQDPEWPAGTIVGVDKKFGYSFITSTSVNYKAVEEQAIRRSTKIRFDSGSMVERFMVDAWDILDFN